MKITKAEMVWDGRAALGEGPFWDETDKQLYWVDIEGYKLNQFNPATKENKALPFAQHVTAVVKKQTGGFVLAMRDGIYTYYRDRLTPYFLLPDKGATMRFNDAKCDPFGRLWAGTMAFDGKSPIGSLYMLDENEQVTEKVEKLAISNGMAWDTKRNLFYHNETTSGETSVYHYNKEAVEITKIGTVPIDYRSYGGGPDGMTIDEHGKLWVALYGGGCVIQIDPNSGAVEEKITVAASNVTSCAFGDDDYKTLYVTTAKKEGEFESGALFAARLEVAGARSYSYKSN